ncbi:MAG TPA: hypothetical protein VN922_20440 [Bacteroidia bacterium]|nr:hypothetical protein [Bacteroidia bacterium]
MRTIVLGCLCVLVTVSCTRLRNEGIEKENLSASSSSYTSDSKLVPGEYVKWVEDEQNGLKKKKEIEDIVFYAQYKPLPYIVCEEERKNDLPDTTIKRRTSELKGMQYLTLKIELKQAKGELLRYGISTTDDYNSRVSYFSFDMQKDLQLVEEGDTLPCLLFNYERIYGLAPYATFSLAFAKGKNINADKTLILFDHIFNKGLVKFYFKGKDIEAVPQVAAI